MNRKIGMLSSLANTIAVIGFALSMIAKNNIGSYVCSMFIAFSFVPMICSYLFYSKEKARVAGIIAICFSCMYAVIICLVYFAQITTVRIDNLTQQSAMLLDFEQFSLFFNYDMLGYALMSLSTFFIGLTIETKTKTDKGLKILLLLHGVFSISCFIIPTLGVFSSSMVGGDLIGIAVLEFWCLYFTPISILSFLHFSKIQ